jgi:phosphatidylglycerophosphatase C
MTSEGPDDERTEGSGRPGVAAFDFDGTLAERDTMVPFLVRTHGWPRLALQAVLAGPKVRPNAAGWRDSLKVATVGRLFQGMPTPELNKLAEAYAESLHDLLRSELVEQLRWHQHEGHATVIVSASLAVYLHPVAGRLGIDDVLAVELEADEAGVLTGKVAGGLNTRGAHKVTRLRGWMDRRFGPGTPVELWAYGDSSGDKELLAAADHPTWIS